MSREILFRIIFSVSILALLFLLRNFSIRHIQKREYHSAELRVRAVAHTKNIFLILIVLALSVIWITQLKDFALSLTAMAVAIVIATKELILCISGGVLRNLSRSFRIGDRITVAEYRGDVVDVDMFTTTLLEIGPGSYSHQYTGRSVSVPNSLFLIHGVINETFTDEYILHVFSVPLSIKEDWQKAEKLLLEAAEEVVSEYKEQAREKMEKLGQKTGLEVPNVEPRVTVVLHDAETYHLLLRLPAPSLRKGKIEQAVIRRFLEQFRG